MESIEASVNLVQIDGLVSSFENKLIKRGLLCTGQETPTYK